MMWSSRLLWLWTACLAARRAASLTLGSSHAPQPARAEQTAEPPSAKSGHQAFVERISALQTNSSFSPEQYQDFIDFFPVTRFNNLVPFSRYTREAGTHYFPTSSATRLPGVMDRFDWCVMGGKGYEHRRVADPQTVWVGASQLGLVLEEMTKWDPNRTDRVLVMNGDAWFSDVFGAPGRNPYADEPDPLDSRAAAAYGKRRKKIVPKVEDKVRKLKGYFDRIFFEAKDLDVKGVETMPIGFTEFFLRNGVAERAAAAVAGARVEDKPGEVKGSFSFYHDLHNCQRGWGEGAELRLQAKEWSRSPPALAAGVDSKPVEPADWWSTLARFKFLMTPNGCGVQTPKQTEALWVLTVPIARRGPYVAYDDLVRYGFPMVVVDEWDEITPSSTADWWKKLSPRLVSFRENCLTSEAYWRLFTGQVTRCE